MKVKFRLHNDSEHKAASRQCRLHRWQLTRRGRAAFGSGSAVLRASSYQTVFPGVVWAPQRRLFSQSADYFRSAQTQFGVGVAVSTALPSTSTQPLCSVFDLDVQNHSLYMVEHDRQPQVHTSTAVVVLCSC